MAAVLCLVSALCSSSFAQTPTRVDQSLQDRQALIEAAVKQLTAEAKEIDQLEEPDVKPVFTRPHPLLRNWDPDMGELVLKRMSQKLTGNDYRDTYIRWHLIEPVKAMLTDRFEQFKQTGEHKLPDDTSKLLFQLVAAMPDQIRNKWQDSEKWVPEDLAGRYWQPSQSEPGADRIPAVREGVLRRRGAESRSLSPARPNSKPLSRR